jgi:hypothetical protein
MRLTTDGTDNTDWGAVTEATWFESLAFASHQLQRCPRRDYLPFSHEGHEAHEDWRSADFRRFRFLNQERRKSGNGGGDLKLVRLPRSLAATLAAFPSISEIPFLDSAFLFS